MQWSLTFACEGTNLPFGPITLEENCGKTSLSFGQFTKVQEQGYKGTGIQANDCLWINALRHTSLGLEQ